MTVVVPPQAAERVPVSKSSAMRAGGCHRLVEVAMRVDAAGRDDAAGGIDLARRRAARPAPELRDAAAADADVAVEGVAGGGDTGVADDQVKGHGHTLAALLWC